MTGRPTLTTFVAARPAEPEEQVRLDAITAGLSDTPAEVVVLDAAVGDPWQQCLASLAGRATSVAAFIAEGVTPLPGTIAALAARLAGDDALTGVSAHVVGIGVAQPHAGCTWPNRANPDTAGPVTSLCWAARREAALRAAAAFAAGQSASTALAGFDVHPAAVALTPQPVRLLPSAPQLAPRALVLDVCTPTPDRDSGSADAFHYMRLLRQLGWSVTFVPVDNYLWFGPYTQALEDHGITCLDWPRVGRLDTYLEAHGADFDLVMLWRVQTAQHHLEAVRFYCPRARTIFVTVDLHFVRLEREARLARDAGALSYARDVARQELAIADTVDLTIAISEVEASLLRKLRPNVRVGTMPIVRPVPGRREGYRSRRDIAFIGGYRHPPNVDAVLHFVQSIWPGIRARLPEATFFIVGPDAPLSISSLGADGVTCRGHVPDLGEVLDRVRLTVAPLRYGAGQKGKVVSSLSYGVPVVLTTIAAEGMNIVDGKHAIVRDDPAGFAEAVIDAYRDEAAWTRLSDNGLQLARLAFSVERGREALTDALNAVGLAAGAGVAGGRCALPD